MLENRSFDNMLGWLYDPANAPPFDRVPRGQPFDGVSGKSLTNPVPSPLGGGLASVGRTTDMSSPNPNPNEPYPDVYGQLFDVNPPPPIIPDSTMRPGMQGFVANYAEAIRAYNSTHPATAVHADPRAIMHGFAPESVPVIAGLASAYAVCDRWFSSVPTETFPNRSFLHTGNSAGYVFNNWKTGKAPWEIGLLVNKSPTIFNLLEDAAVSWRIYHGGSLLTCFGYLLHERLHPFATPDPHANRLFEMDQFWKDAAAADGLPAYSFIEPRYFSSVKHGAENDQRPIQRRVGCAGRVFGV